MMQGTTPTHHFTLPFGTEMVAAARVIYAQNEKVVFKKELKDCQCVGNIISVKLTQEETLKLSFPKSVQIQLRILTLGGDALNSKIYTMCVEECLDKEVL